MSKVYMVLLEDGTAGTIDSDTIDGGSIEGWVGEWVTVHLHDENGNPIEEFGVLSEILCEI